MTTEMKDSAFRAYEEYVLKDRKVEEGLKSLVEGSDSFDYLKSIDILTQRSANMTREDRAFLESYIIRNTSIEARKLGVRYEFAKYDTANEEDKKRILDKISSHYMKGNFEHQRPNDLGVKKVDESGEAKVGGEEKPVLDEIDVMGELEELYRRSHSPGNYDRSMLARVDFSKLQKDHFLQLLKIMGDDTLMLDVPTFYDTYAKWLAEDYKVNKYYGIDISILLPMTIDQMDKLRAKLPGLAEDSTFAGIYTTKKFSRELSEEENAHLTYKEKRVNLMRMYEYAKTLPHKLSGLKSSLLLEILENGLKLDLYEEGYFMEYLNLPARTNLVKRSTAPDVGSWSNCLYNVQAAHNRNGQNAELVEKDRELMRKYLQYFYAHGKTAANFMEFLEQRFLVEVWEDTLLMAGNKVEFKPENTARLEKLAMEVNITIGDQNKDVFGIGEDVTLWVELKNVPTLFIKVFEINTENYYRKNMAPFRSDVNLDGLIASIERTVEYKQPPYLRFKTELQFAELKDKVGLFVIELIGNGKSSRAILKIGTLSLVTRQTVAGQVAFILDGERRICAHDSTGIWMDDQYFKANVEKGGRIMVPYVPSGGSRSSKAILLHQGLAQLVDFMRMEEVYSLQCGFYMLPESFLMGKNATIMVRPQLQINGKLADLSLLKNIKCVLHTSNFIDNIPSTKDFNNLTLSASNELLIKFQVGANASEMRLDFMAEIANISKDKKEILAASHRFEFATHTGDYATAEFYLRLNPARQYELLVLGKNGEPISQMPVALTFSSNLFIYTLHRSGTTNAQGVIKLGRLKGVRDFAADLTQSSGRTQIHKSWVLPAETVLQYPSVMDIVEDEQVDLPIARELAKERFYLRSFVDNTSLANCSSAMAVEEVRDELYSTVHIKGLKSGSYFFRGAGNTKILIHVHKGAYWKENPDYILKQYSLLENNSKHGFVKIKQVSFEETKEGKSRMNIQIDGATKDQWRVHVLFFRYLPENLTELTFRLLSRDLFASSESFFQKWKNIYLSNRELSSEFRYCFDRRHQPRFTGNTLDKPKLILKRTLIQSTHTDQEDVSGGTAYNYRAEMQEMAQRQQVIQSVPMQQAYYQDPSCNCMPEMNDIVGAANSYQQSASYSPSATASQATADRIPVFQNFLGLEPLARYNMPASPDGKITLELDEKCAEKYSCALVLAVDKGSVAHYLHPLSGTTVQKRDLSLAKPLSGEKMYSEMRTTKCVEKHDAYLIEDITNTDLQIVDSLEKVLLIVKELMRMYGVSIADFDKFERLIQWNGLGEEEKNKMMSRYTSHELHLFIAKKDPEYFAKVVKGYLENKMEKSFIDYYLLKDLPELMHYATNPSLHESLNPLEKALLVESLIASGNKKLALGITQRMRNALLAQKKTAAEQNRVFDTVLSLGTLKTAKDEVQKLMEEEKCRAVSPRLMNEEQDELCMPEEPAPMYQDDSNMHSYKNRAPLSRCRKQMAVKHMIRRSGASNSGSDDDFVEERAQRKPALEELGETKEYAETHYYGDTSGKYWKNRVDESEFWADYAEYITSVEMADGKPKKPFLTQAFTGTYRGLTAIFGALSLLDLPFYSLEHGFRTMEGRSAELKAASNLIIFKKEIKESKGEIRSNILVAMRYVDWEQAGDEDAKIEEFLVSHIYTCQVIITNISSHKLEFEVLIQIPQGSLPIGLSPYQKSHSISLNSYSTNKIEYQFYFPGPGKFMHFPANVSINSVVVAKSNTEPLNVLKERTKISEENFREVLSTGNYELILNFLREKPIDGIKGFSWNDLYWLLRDAKFYEPLLALMKQQHRFEATVWSYSLFHKKDEAVIAEFLNSQDYLKKVIGYYFDSKLITVRPIDSDMRHLDYYPLINPRAHKPSTLSGAASTAQPMILNGNLYATYKRFILYLIEKKSWDVADKMNLAFYLLLQDRVTEALGVFGKIDPTKELAGGVWLKLQYDYMSAYLDFYVGAPEFKVARKIVAAYLEYPVITWRLLFLDMDQQLKEYDGVNIEEGTVEGEERKEVGKKKQIKTEPQLGIVLEGKEVVVDYNNIAEVAVKYYIIDLEILFSRAPFLTQNTEDFSYVRPNSSETVVLDPKMKERRIRIPEKYGAKNVVIEVNGGGIQKLVTYFSTSLKLQIFENYGELKVSDESGKQLAEVYVKAFVMKKDGTVAFYKDGYTDIRGRFDYVSLNASQLANAKKLALFVMSDKYGSLIKECNPPSTTIRPEEDLGPVKTRVAEYYNKQQKCVSKARKQAIS